MQTYIFASDPHGTGKPWINKVQKMQAHYPDAVTVFGGDYIDGRKYNKETLEFVFRETKQNNAVALLGNHEQMFLDFIFAKNTAAKFQNYEIWKENGAKSTIKSLTGHNWSPTKSANQLIQQNSDLIEWLITLEPLEQTTTLVFVHAGLDWQKPDPINGTSRDDLMWLREAYWWQKENIFNQYTVKNWAHNPTKKTIISGHTPTCLLTGKYDFNQGIVKPSPAEQQSYNCPIIKVKYPNEPARYFTDGGCHGQMPNHTGNIIAINEHGKILKTLN